MFIEKVTLKNLASLRGAWEIDFTQPEYENGIFAIIGTNGAGKSTILDAICLALYGQTPRQKTFNALCDEIMSKNTTSCAASVTFRTAKGTFTARWEHRRTTRKNSKKPFSLPERFFSCENDPTICSSKSGEVAQLVQEYTGLSFEQFTQSVMLAQFQFEKFLTATTENRTKILETLTGTGYYKELVLHAQDIQRERNKEIETLRSQSQMIQPRSEAEMAKFSAERDTLKMKIETNEKKIKDNIKELSQLQKWNSLQKKIQDTNTFREELEKAQNAFLPARQRLEKAEHAQVVDPVEAQFLAVVAEGKTCAIEIENLNDKKIDLLKKEADYSAKLETAQELVKKCETNYAQILPRIQKTREVDINLKNARQILRQFTVERESTEMEMGKEEKNLKESNKNINFIRNKLTEYRNLLPLKEQKSWKLESENELITQAITAKPEILMTYNEQDKELAQLLKTLTDAKNLEEEITEVRPKVETAEREMRSFLRALEVSQKMLETERKNEEKTAEKMSVQQRKLQEDAEREKLEYSLQNTASILMENMEKLTKNVAETKEKNEAEKKCQEDLNVTREKIVRNKNSLDSSQRQMAVLREMLSNLRAIQSYEAARQELTEGEPCPLCGAIHHPYTVELPMNFLRDGEDERIEIQELEVAKKKLEMEIEQLEDEEKKIIAEQAKIENGIHSLSEEKIRILAKIENHWNLLIDLYSRIKNTSNLEIKIEENAEISKYLDKILDFAQVVYDELRKCAEIRNANKKIYEELFHKNELARKTVRETEVMLKKQEMEFLALKESFTAQNLRLGEKSKWLDTLEQEILVQEAHAKVYFEVDKEEAEKQKVPVNLKEKIVFWRAISDSQTKLWELWNKIRTLGIEGNRQESHKKQLEDIFERAKSAFLQKKEECKKRNEEIKSLESERRELLGEQNPDVVENELKNAEKRAKEELETFKNELLKVEKEREFTEKQLAEKSATCEKLREAARQKLDVFRTVLQQELFADEEEYQSAKMAREEREELSARKLKLQKQADQLEGIDRQNRQEMETFQGKAPTTATEAELEARIKEKEEENRENHQKIGRLTEIFEEQERVLKRNAELDGKILRAEKEAERWVKLGNVLKSAGTNKTDSFVNFVQSITFNNLLYYANQQLRLLNPRYELRTDPMDPASLQLLDEQHERTPRAPESLSGGESFILSLALALGLTRIASRNVEINSFFIDEGFGSLASEALESALNALKNYHRESNKRGKKLIGVISHVDAIHNEIGTIIQLTPYPPRQFSRMTGPGVSGSER
ncbi:MAG: AAA family ATPase [Planctomycetia bacterium]|nr:AAA family ATPase [Planctomycetia bacterium]